MAEGSSRDFSGQLRRIRFRRRLLWGVFLSYLPAVWLATRLVGEQWAGFALTLLWLVAAGAAGVGVSLSRCPLCGELFHMEGLMTSWSGRCVHCGQGLRSGGSDA